jgi:long-chain acyl-CoA synthetase
MELEHTHNAANIFFDQAAREDLRDRPRFLVQKEGGGWIEVTWGELALRVERLASFLIDRGVDAGSKVAIMANTRLEWGVAVLALMAARGTLVPVYPTLTAEHLIHILGHSDSEVLVVETAEHLKRVLQVWDRLSLHTLITLEPMDVQAAARAAGLDPQAVAARAFPLAQAEELGASTLEAAGDKVRTRLSEIRLEDVSYLVYTSGTTGLPKGVPLTHANTGMSGLDWVEINGPLVHQGDVDILWLPMSHLYGLGQFFLGNQIGFQTYLSDPLGVLPLLPEVRPHIFMSVPVYWEKMMQLAQAAAPDEAGQHAALKQITGGRLSFCLSGGAGLAREVKEFFHRAGILIIEGYGLTECSPNLTFNRHDDFDFDTVGKPTRRVQLELAPDAEILAKGPNVFSGYYKDPEATAAVFDDEGWLHTGDLGRFTDRGFLQIIGRKKEILVTSGGKNIPPANIELRFKDHPLFAHVMVYGDGKKYLTALVDINDEVAAALLRSADETVEPGALRRHPKVRSWIEEGIEKVNGQLARFETIKSFFIAPEPLTVEGNMLTPTLKLKRQNIARRYGDQLEALYRQA